jgi:hypothetical protein
MVDPAKGFSEIPQMLLVPEGDLGDPLLNYFALGLLIFVVVVNSYAIIAVLRKLIFRGGTFSGKTSVESKSNFNVGARGGSQTDETTQ